MLQQTQVSTVLSRFYYPFLEKFPTVQSLGNAPREAVMKAWEGLGYYRRAGFLHEAAKRAHNGLPDDFVGLSALPGIGRNTASAILAFGHHQPVAILEANVKRVVSRIFTLEYPNEKQLWECAEQLLDRDQPFNYNQAMMDIGSSICTPKNPRCAECPANVICEGQKAPEKYPAPKVKKAVPVRHVAILVMQDATGKLYLEKRDEALLGGLWGFPQEVPPPEGEGIYLAHVTHIYTHFRLEGVIYLKKIDEKKRGTNWFSREEIAALPLSKLDHKVLAAMDACNTASANARPKPRTRRRA